MNVVYIDTGYDLSSAEKTKVATVILAHGAGQTHKDMLPLAENLAQEGFRVVVPNFPGMGLTQSSDHLDNKMYGHTVEENMDFLGNFIHFLGIGKVDLIIGHSAACYALASLVTFLQHVDGYVYVCPGTGPEPPQGVQPYWFFKTIVWMWEHPLLWPIVAAAIKLLAIPLSKGAIPNEVRSATIALQSLIGARLYLTPKLAVMLKELNIPLLYCFTTGDPLISEQQYKDYAELNGISSFDVYDKELKLIEEGKRDFSDRFCLGLKFDLATHHPMKKLGCREILVKHIKEIFHYNQKKFKNT
ncbi:hypothetical protein CAPTEDRAFT_221854 [Capitella teleta]|uniref:AB hydrolase-1 domain-containing protein n=1 Tax=Capitella teleta TaxID=283909 RepID=R7VCB0_CAPTE|nr:hypothetical protein CAPTEDRAFT_221854 [Capitella teleta]|eukprot:ELU16254.1 hypothetical protein CAPTEDRAFT_221854 [Capitella teleta]